MIAHLTLPLLLFSDIRIAFPILAEKWVTDLDHLKLIVEKAFDEHVIEHLGLTALFDSLGLEPLLHISSVYFLDLVCEFYADMFHKI